MTLKGVKQEIQVVRMEGNKASDWGQPSDFLSGPVRLIADST